MEEKKSVTKRSREERKRRYVWLIVALLGAVAAGVLLASTVWQDRWPDEESAAGNELINAVASNPEQLCASQATYDSIRRELFRRAAQIRGSDQQAYARLADFALLRVSSPVLRGTDDQLRSVSCSGTANLDLPPGVAAGGRRSLSGDLDYIVQPAADGSGNAVRLGNADSIVVPLATLSRFGAPETAPLIPPDLQNQMMEGPLVPDEADGMEAEEPPPAPAANPSFDCGSARTRGEIAVCGDPGLAALDRQMVAQFNAALSQADRSQRRLLQRTRGRFISYRDRCATNQCVAETYQSRMSEIRDIMGGRWRG
ncbi:MAG TPA: hypothetical protein VFU80_04525 [Sphingomicrobium sp.]|nr:hypothetical protein [Sphingomicrobium sp.]